MCSPYFTVISVESNATSVGQGTMSSLKNPVVSKSILNIPIEGIFPGQISISKIRTFSYLKSAIAYYAIF